MAITSGPVRELGMDRASLALARRRATNCGMSSDPDQPNTFNFRFSRRWCPADSQARLGPFASPATRAAECVDLTEVSDVPCVVLLGEPGAGKTWELRRLFDELLKRGERVDYIAARAIASHPDPKVHLPAESLRQWARHGRPWHVLIDGVDEIGAGDSNAAALLNAFLDELQVGAGPDRLLSVVMTCRTAAWSAELDEAVERRWATESTLKLALEPLDEAEINIGIATVERDPVKRTHLARLLLDDNLRSIAGRPLLLRMMLQRYHTDGVLPEDQSALFRGAVEALLGAARFGSDLDTSQKLLLAARIAAASTFSGLMRLASGIASDAAHCLFVNRIAGGTESSPRGTFAVTPAALIAVLESGLFIQIDHGIYEFRDRSFREFLTALYLVDHRLSPDQMMSLLAIEEVDGPGGIAPQLQEVAAWAAAMTPALFDVLIAREPDILLKSDATAMKPADRSRLTAAVLQRFASEDLLDRRGALVPLFVRLDHQELAGQLNSIIANVSAPRHLRIIAIDIAEITGQTSLISTLLATATDDSSDVLVRTWAVRAVGKLSPDAIASLAPILAGDLSSDGEDRLRGALLRLCWPTHITFDQLLNALTPPKQRNHIGTYFLFLRRLRFINLRPHETIAAIDWLRSRLAAAAERGNGLRPVMNRLFWAAAANIHLEEIKSAFANLIIDAGSELPHILASDREDDENWSKNAKARSALVAETIRRSRDPVRSTSVLLHFLPDLVRTADLGDYLTLLLAEGPARESIAQIVVALCDQMPINELTSVWDTATQVPQLQLLLAQRYAVDLSSDAAKWMRERAARAREEEKRREQATVVVARRHENIQSLLDRIEAGDAGLWWQLNHELMRDESGHRSEFEFRSDLTAMPGWGLLDETTRQRVVTTAFAYLTEAPLSDTSWLGTNTSHRPANAGVRALRLLRDKAPKALAELSDGAWEAWTPALIGFFDTEDALTELIQEAWRHAPDAVLEAVRVIALSSNSKGLTSQTLELIAGVMHPPVVRLLEKLRDDPSLQGADTHSSLFLFLVRMGVASAVREVTDALENGAADAGGTGLDDGEAVNRAVAELVLKGSVKTWGLLLQLRSRNAPMATAVWRELAEQAAFEPLPILDELDAWSLGQGCIDLAELLPEQPSTEIQGRISGVPDYVERLRNMIVGRLVAMGTNAALQQLERLASLKSSEREALRGRINEARRNVRARTAVRPDPSDILMQISAMGRRTSKLESLPPPVVPLINDASDNTIPMDVPAPDPEPKGPLPEEHRHKILLIATEWLSVNGGISTLNRELCRALAALGHTVACLVRSASDTELNEAQALGIVLVACPTSEGIDEGIGFLLCGERELGMRPDIVIGHDHITGQFGRALATRFDAKYIHFLHTIPQENEGLKSDRGNGGRPLLSGEKKLRAQIRLASVSDLVVAVGPRIRRMFCHEATSTPKIITFIPGLNEALLTVQPRHDGQLLNQCLMIGRMEDAGVKGVQLACDFMKAVVEGRAWPSGQTPKLRIRGFSPDGADAEIEVIEDFKTKYARFVSPRGFSIDAEELRTELERTGLFVMPSVAEGFGLTGYEAIAAGIPVIVSAESGLAEFLREEVSGGALADTLIAPCVAIVASTAERNAADWQEKVEAALIDRPTAFQRAEHIRNALKNRYRWETAARSLSTEFKSL